jgi:hypothetical protein
MDKSSSFRMPMSPQEISKRYKHQSLGMPRGTPSSSAKIRSPFNILYFYCFIFYAFFLERLYFCFQFYFILFAAINGWTHQISFGEGIPCFLLPRTLYFSLLSFNECSLFLELHLAFIFRHDFCLDIVLSWHQGVFRPLVYVSFHQKSCLKKVWMVLKEKKFHAKKVVQKGACLDCGLDFCMPCLMSFW